MVARFKVLDVRVDELAANLNALSDDPWGIISQDYYSQDGVRRVSVLLVKAQPQVATGMPIDPRLMRRN